MSFVIGLFVIGLIITVIYIYFNSSNKEKRKTKPMSIPIRMKVKFKDGTIVEDVRPGTISYDKDLDDIETWKNWWRSLYRLFKMLQSEGHGPEKELDMEQIEWFQPMDKDFKIYVDEIDK